MDKSETLSAEDQDVLQKLDEARKLYEDYLSIKAKADLEVLRELADWAKREEPDVRFVPQPLTITFRS